MSTLLLISDNNMKRLQSSDYDELMDWQFNTMQDLIDASNEIIHLEYKDENILQQGIIMLRKMVILNMINRAFVERYQDSEIASFIRQQYTIIERSTSELISEEINSLKEHFDEIKDILNEDYDNEERRVAGVKMVNRIATLNLREYEDAFNRAFSEPEKV